MSQEEFAEECGVSNTLVSLIETEKENITIDTMQLLSARMDMTVSELFRYENITYFVYPSVETVEGLEYSTYGIGALCNGVMVDCVPDVSTNFERMKAFVALCNSESLSLIHLRDIAEDIFQDR